jgi:hypothetical protein
MTEEKQIVTSELPEARSARMQPRIDFVQKTLWNVYKNHNMALAVETFAAMHEAADPSVDHDLYEILVGTHDELATVLFGDNEDKQIG